jgi:hypothetical protein
MKLSFSLQLILQTHFPPPTQLNKNGTSTLKPSSYIAFMPPTYVHNPFSFCNHKISFQKTLRKSRNIKWIFAITKTLARIWELRTFNLKEPFTITRRRNITTLKHHNYFAITWKVILCYKNGIKTYEFWFCKDRKNVFKGKTIQNSLSFFFSGNWTLIKISQKWIEISKLLWGREMNFT